MGFVMQSLRVGWRWLTRMRTALYLLGVLGLLTVVATIVPQSPNVPTTVRQWRSGEAGPGVVVAQLIDLIGGFDVYGSPAFLAFLLLLFLSLTACLIPRYRAFLRLARHSRPPRIRRLDTQEQVATFVTDRDPEDVLATARALLATRRWRLRPPDGPAPDATAPAPQVAAEKGLVAREGGSLVFHTSFYVLLVAIVLGQLLGFVGQVGIVEGHSWAETAVGYWTYQPGRWWSQDDHRGFTLTLDRFNVDWHRDPTFGGQPSLFLSDVTIQHPDGTITTDTVGGNDPLIVDGLKIHQLDWGYAPRVVIEKDGELLHDAYLTAIPTDRGFFRSAAKAPAADPDVGLELLLVPYAPPDEEGRPTITGAPWADAPLLVFQEFVGDLRLSASQNVNDLDKTALTEAGSGVLRLGEALTLDDGVTVRFPELRRWVGFQVSSRPTVPWLLLGAVLVLIGLIPALYAYRRRLWIEARTDDEGRTLVTVAGRAFQRPQAFEDEHATVVRTLEQRLRGGAPSDDGTPSTGAEPPEDGDDRDPTSTEAVHQ